MPSESVSNGATAVALAATGVFAGAALFITAVEHPAAMETSTSNFYGYFPAMYRRAARLQGGLAVLGSHAAMVAAAKASDKDTRLMWSVSGALLGAVWPYTLLVMMPTNKQILQQDEKSEAVQSSLLVNWGKLHAVRTVLSCTAFGVMIATVLQKRSTA